MSEYFTMLNCLEKIKYSKTIEFLKLYDNLVR